MKKAKLIIIIPILSTLMCCSQNTVEIIDSITHNFVIKLVLKKDSIIEEISLNEYKNKPIKKSTHLNKSLKRAYFGATDEFRIKLSAHTFEEKTPFFEEKGEVLRIGLNGGEVPLRSIFLFEDKLVGYDIFNTKIYIKDSIQYLEMDSVNAFFCVQNNFFLDSSFRSIKIFEEAEKPNDSIDGEDVIKYSVDIDFEKYKINKEICINVFINYSHVRQIYLRKENGKYYYKRTFTPSIR